MRVNTQLLTMIVDELQIVMYQQRAASGSKRNPKPKLLSEKIKDTQAKSKYKSFDTAEDFNMERERILKGG